MKMHGDRDSQRPSPTNSTSRPLPRAFKWVRRDRQSLLILCYHGVSGDDEHVWDSRLYIHKEAFRRRLQTLSDFGYRVLPLSEAFQRLRQDALTGPTAVLTFDDGWHDFYSVAWPILQEFGFPATVYQTSYYAQYNRPVFDTTCRYLLWRGKGRIVRAQIWPGGLEVLDLTNDRSIARITQMFFRATRDFSGEQKDTLLETLAQAVGVDYGAIIASRKLHLMNVGEIAEISGAGIDVQLHTHRHRLPTDRRLFLQELADNRAWIEAATRTPAHHFCYPNGAYRPEFLSWLREAGVGFATTCEPGVATRRSEPLLLPRFTDADSISRRKFESWLTGVGRIAPAVKRAFRFKPFLARTPLHTAPAHEAAADAVRTWA